MLIRLFKNFIIFFLVIFYSLQLQLFATDDTNIEIDRPRFTEKGLNDRLYEIKAERGIQKKNNLELFAVEGKFRTNSGIWVYLNADQGNFNQIKNVIELNGNIIFYTDKNEKFHSEYASFYINEDIIEFNKNVKHIRGENIVTSDASVIKNNFSNIIYQGNVKTFYIND